MKTKKGQGLSLNVIILAVLGLVVLIVLIFIFTGKINIFNKSTTCEARDGVCLHTSPEGCPDDKPIKIYTSDCKEVKDNQPTEKHPGQCCIPIG